MGMMNIKLELKKNLIGLKCPTNYSKNSTATLQLLI